MIELIHIDQQNCPHCGSEPSVESIGAVHVSGGRTETRKFMCGCTLTYDPVTVRVVTLVKCPTDPELIADRIRINKTLSTLKGIVSSKKLDSWMIKAIHEKLDELKQ